jgi:hypothetical protein
MLAECKLCGKVSHLSKSHILPEFVFKPLYDEIGRANTFNPNSDERGYIQNGPKEYLLCKNCEGIFAINEQYASRLFSSKFKSVESLKIANKFRVSGINYKKLKLFSMSILWRASISSHQLYKFVKCGPHEEILRATLLESNPMSESDYKFFIQPFDTEIGSPETVVLQPISYRLQGAKCYRFTFLGMFWFCLVISHRINAPKEIFLSEEGEISLVPVKTDVSSLFS